MITLWTHLACGLPSRSRSDLRSARRRAVCHRCRFDLRKGTHPPAKVDTPYAPTRCQPTRADARKAGMTVLHRGMTIAAKARMAKG